MSSGKNQWLAGGAGLLAGAAAVALVAGVGRDTVVQTGDRGAVEKVVREYILSHPEIIPEAITVLQDKQTAKLIDPLRKQIETPFAGAWAGSSNPDATLVMFTDYSCGYCKASVKDVERLLKEDKNLRIVWRELPILGPGSDEAARVALAAAKQGHYMAFHRAMFAGGPVSPEKIAQISGATGVKSDFGLDIEAEVEGNLKLARSLRVNGTPVFVVGDRLLNGAVGYDELKSAVKAVRDKA